MLFASLVGFGGMMCGLVLIKSIYKSQARSTIPVASSDKSMALRALRFLSKLGWRMCKLLGSLFNSNQRERIRPRKFAWLPWDGIATRSCVGGGLTNEVFEIVQGLSWQATRKINTVVFNFNVGKPTLK